MAQIGTANPQKEGHFLFGKCHSMWPKFKANVFDTIVILQYIITLLLCPFSGGGI